MSRHVGKHYQVTKISNAKILVTCQLEDTAFSNKTEIPTRVVSGRRQICLLIVGVHHLARLLAHLHMSLHICSSAQILCIPLSSCENMMLTYNISHALKVAIFTGGMLGHHIQMASDTSRRLYFEGLGTGQGLRTWQSYPLGPE